MNDWQSQLRRTAPALILLAAGFPLQAQCGQGPCAASGTEHAGTAHIADPGAETMDVVDSARQLDNLVAQLHNRNSVSRVQALEAIAASLTADNDKVNRVLRDALEDEDPMVEEAALRALMRRGEDPGLTESELQRTLGESSELARVQTAARNQDASSLKELMRNGDAVVQEAAFAELAVQDRNAAVSALKEELFDRDSLYRLQTLELFARSPYANSNAMLMPILEEASRDEDAVVKERAESLLKEKKAESEATMKSAF
jgi:hypothetical protein